MLTILIRYQKSLREVLIEAESVEFVREQGPHAVDKPGLLVNHGTKAKDGFHLEMTAEGDEDWRDVFVMNASGQTVARYTL